jgi:hypothetical protein
MSNFLGVGGTNDYNPSDSNELRWWRRDSPFSLWMEEQGFTYNRPDRPFWSTALDGWWGSGHRTWRHGGANVASFLATLPYADRNVITLSHGGNVMAYALADYDVDVASWISVTMPVRKDMQAAYEKAIPKVGTYTHVYAKGFRDRWQLLGSLMDKSLRYKRHVELKSRDVVNIGVEGIGHSSLVRDPSAFELWKAYGLLKRLGPIVESVQTAIPPLVSQ